MYYDKRGSILINIIANGRVVSTPASYSRGPMGTGGPFHGCKARPGRDADHSPPSSAEVVNEWKQYLLSPCASIKRCGTALAFYRVQISARRPAILTEGYHAFPHSLQANAGLSFKLGHDRFRSHPFQLVIHISHLHPTLHSLRKWKSIVK
jgi:hypothetical protein